MRRLGVRRFSTTAARRNARPAPPPLIRIANGTFYRHSPSAHAPADNAPNANPPLFPGLDFTLPAFSEPNQHWSILSPSSAARTAFLQILRGQHLAEPAAARSFPYLLTDDIAAKDPRLRNPQRAIRYVGFDAERGGLSGGASTKGAYLSARYESMREVTDWSVRDYLQGNTELNADETLAHKPPPELVGRVMADLNLEALADMPVSHLSNGQTRRARIAKALLARPEVLLLDGPFMGLDPHTLQYLSRLLHRLAEARQPRLVLSLRPQDVIPEWITHFVVVGSEPKVSAMGTRREIFDFLRETYETALETEIDTRVLYQALQNKEATQSMVNRMGRKGFVDAMDKKVDEMTALFDIARKMEAKGDFDGLAKDPEKVAKLRTSAQRMPAKGSDTLTRDGVPLVDSEVPLGKPVVQMEGVKIQYADSDRPVLGDWKQSVGCGKPRAGLWWEVKQGQRWGVFGPNGSGKTTLLSLITSDHPQTYSAPVKLFGRSRLPSPGVPGISIFDIQARMGHSSPEVHTFFPKHLTVRRVLESAWADTPLTKPRLNYDIDQRVNACLRWFRNELHPELGQPLDLRGETFRSTREAYISRHLEVVATSLHDEEALLWPSIDWADSVRFGELTFSAQRVALFLRAIVKQPELVVLDEAFSGMDELARDKCLLFLHHGEAMTLRHVYQDLGTLRSQGPRAVDSDIGNLKKVRVPGLSAEQALVVVSHAREDVPGSVREYITLPEPGTGEPPRIGRLDGPLAAYQRRWGEIWGLPKHLPKSQDPDEYSAIWGKGSPDATYNRAVNVLQGLEGEKGERRAMRAAKKATPRRGR